MEQVDGIPIRVIVPTYKRTELLSRTLNSLAECRLPAGFRGVLVVENGEQCGAEAVCADAAVHLRVSYLYCEEGNKSLALNHALEHVGDELLIFLDDDIRLEEETLCAYAAMAEEAGRGTHFGGPVQPDYETEPLPWLYLPRSVKGWSLPAGSIDSPAAGFLGANWAAWSTVLQRLGGFNPELGPGGTSGARGQESEMQWRLRGAGVAGRYVEDALVWHWIPAERCSVAWSLSRSRQHALSTGAYKCPHRFWWGTTRWVALRLKNCWRTVSRGEAPAWYALRLQWERISGYLMGRCLRLRMRKGERHPVLSRQAVQQRTVDAATESLRTENDMEVCTVQVR